MQRFIFKGAEARNLTPTCNGAAEAMPSQISRQRRRRDSGAMLLAVLFMMAMMVIVALAMAPSLVQQIKRDREEEMIHRGTEYARAVRRFYKRFGRYPSNLEQLDNTNQIRFLRKRFNDPLTKGGKWKLLTFTDVQSILGVPGLGIQPLAGGQAGAPGVVSQTTPAGAAGSANLGATTALAGAQLLQQQPDAANGAQAPVGQQAAGAATPDASGGDAGAAQAGFGFGSSVSQTLSWNGAPTPGAQGQGGNGNSSSGTSGAGGQTYGGGAIFGVASTSTDPTIRIFNKKQKYNEWVFLYSPMLDRPNVLLRGPYDGKSFTGQQVGIPAGQLNQSNQGAYGQQPGGSGPTNQQQNQQLTPSGQFPPDQSQTQP
jgi:type II secretory pathway pseudopilin PulG